MGVLYDVLFKPIGRDAGGSAAPGGDDGRAAETAAGQPPEWVLDRMDGGSLVWRRSPSAAGRKRVEFLDAVQVRVFERDDECRGGGGGRDDDDDDDCFAGEWTSSWRADDDGGGGSGCTSLLRDAWADKDDYPVLVAVSVTALGLCVGLAYLFAPVKWLLHHLVDD